MARLGRVIRNRCTDSTRSTEIREDLLVIRAPFASSRDELSAPCGDGKTWEEAPGVQRKLRRKRGQTPTKYKKRAPLLRLIQTLSEEIKGTRSASKGGWNIWHE